MAEVKYSARALADLERVSAYLAESGPRTVARALRAIEEAVGLLRRHPYLGRPAEQDTRELVISSGKTGYLALYWVDEVDGTVFVLALRHQRELGYTPY